MEKQTSVKKQAGNIPQKRWLISCLWLIPVITSLSLFLVLGMSGDLERTSASMASKTAEKTTVGVAGSSMKEKERDKDLPENEYEKMMSTQ